jgi:hypothetical protein
MNYTAFMLQNPWREGQSIEDRSVKRDFFAKISEDLDNKEITVITGSRQVGKTTLIKSLICQLLAKGVTPKSIFYFNLDDFNLHPYFKDHTDFIDFIQSEHAGFAYIFIDEIQRVENPGLLLKILYDLNLNMKLVVSGSSSLELKSKISEHLTGRKHTYEIYTFSFEEFLSSKNVGFYFEKPIDALIKFHQGDLNRVLFDFVTYGGYPKVVLSQNIKAKAIELKEIFDSYIKKDVKDFLKIENIGGYNNLIKALALQAGNLINYQELSQISGLNVLTVKKYIDYLEGTYVFKKVLPFFSNARKEISKSPKIYSQDTGLMNYITDRLGINSIDMGSVMENFVFNEINKKGLEIKFWRTGSGSEVDFIIDNIPLEVKSSSLQQPTLSKSFFSYLEFYKPETAFLINLDFFGERKIDGRIVYFYPLWMIPLVLKNFFIQGDIVAQQ